ncbi:helix-turn-helix transcriptional regulator [Globicatella sanguinis]|uniref:helix-turn-helix transcriptional regulator n=1 Tax=Globicatella sanguinis TaxID=13076 RepID=UPI000825E100|nr:helix-turn-helix transcriptional regulator [Globicatella sanguinis]
MNYPQIIKEERLKRSLSQSDFAEKMGVSPTLISLIESGKRGASDKLKVKIANYFNLSVEYIFFNQKDYK